MCKFLGFAIIHNFKNSQFDKTENIVILTGLVWLCVIYYKLLKPFYANHCSNFQNLILYFKNNFWKRQIFRLYIISINLN